MHGETLKGTKCIPVYCSLRLMC